MTEAPRCPESINGGHGPADTYGKCPWCGIKYTGTQPRPPREPILSELDDAYAQRWDPDYDLPGWWPHD